MACRKPCVPLFLESGGGDCGCGAEKPVMSISVVIFGGRARFCAAVLLVGCGSLDGAGSGMDWEGW